MESRTTQVKRTQGTTEPAGEPALPKACDSLVKPVDADGDGVNAPEANTEDAVW